MKGTDLLEFAPQQLSHSAPATRLALIHRLGESGDDVRSLSGVLLAEWPVFAFSHILRAFPEVSACQPEQV